LKTITVNYCFVNSVPKKKIYIYIYNRRSFIRNVRDLTSSGKAISRILDILPPKQQNDKKKMAKTHHAIINALKHKL
jgi:hypothetical protein